MNNSDAGKLGLAAGDQVDVQQDGRGISMQLVIDDGLAEGCVFIPAGTEGSSHLAGSFGPIEVKRHD